MLKEVKEQEKTEKKEKKEKEKQVKKLNLSKQVRAWQIMLYCDQIGHRHEKLTPEQEESILKDYLTNIRFEEGLFYGIVHNKELSTVLKETEYTEAPEKRHIHLVFYTNNQIRPFTILKELGVDITSVDENLYTHGGFSYLNIKRHEVAKAILYLNHQTEAALLENKPAYNSSDIVTNDKEVDWYHKYSEEYSRYSEGLYINKYGQVQQLNEEDKLFDILDDVFELGRNLGDFDIFLENIPRRYKYKYENKIEEYYYKGVHKRYEDKANLDVHRVSLFIYGPPGCGKTYGSVHTLLDLGRKVYQVGQSSGTGGEDGIKPNDCLIYDDRIPKNALDKADTSICELYRRNSHNGIFGGDFFIINHNKCFYDAFKNYYKDKDDESTDLSEEAKALATRFYVLEVTVSGDVLVKGRCTRGLSSDIAIRDEKFNRFLEIFKSYIKTKAVSV